MFQEIRVNSFGIPYTTEFSDASFACSSRNANASYVSDEHVSPSASLSSLAELALTRLEPHSPSSSTSSFSDILFSASSPSLPLQKAADKGTSLFNNRLFSRTFSLRSASSLLRRKPRHAISENHLSCTSPAHPRSSPDLANARSSWIVIPPYMPKPLPPPPQTALIESDMQLAGLYIGFRAEPDAREMHPHPKRRLLRLQQTISSAVLAAGMEAPSTGTGPCSVSAPGNKLQATSGKHPAALFRGTYGQMTTALEGAGLSVTPCHGFGFSGATRLGALFVARSGGSGMQLTKLTLWG
ncbi:hypothetical protein ID866_3619 [Astraeus odoratus]|nr:hypothetical protein ID866_3619 [Astraeus odoratus]